jgi:hypothetical protein
MPIRILIEMAQNASNIDRIAKILKHTLSLNQQNSDGVKQIKLALTRRIHNRIYKRVNYSVLPPKEDSDVAVIHYKRILKILLQ